MAKDSDSQTDSQLSIWVKGGIGTPPTKPGTGSHQITEKLSQALSSQTHISLNDADTRTELVFSKMSESTGTMKQSSGEAQVSQSGTIACISTTMS